MARIDALLRTLKERDGSDLHLVAGLPPRVRLNGSLAPLEGATALDAGDLVALLREICPPDDWATFESDHDVDFAHEVPGVGRFRANCFRQESGPAAVFRIVPEAIRPLDDLGLPREAAALARFERGLVLVTGPTGSGKTTTLAAIIDRINRTAARHIVTIEDPIEFVHSSRRSIVSHRQVGIHARSFAEALRAAMRQDADVILVGEMRDAETIGLALTAAEMGALVFGTLHTSGAARTFDRIVDAFPSDRQPQIRAALADTLQGILSQILLPTADGRGRCVAAELLLRAPGLASIIREGRAHLLASYLQSGRRLGMQTLDDALFALVKRGRILPQDAFRKAAEKDRFAPFLERPGVGSSTT